MKRIAFLDRDGVINVDKSYLYKWSEFEYCDGTIDGLKVIVENNYQIIIITNQSGIARGFYREQDYLKLTNLYLNDLRKMHINILDVIYCPHHPDGIIDEFSFECNCRKPKPGMILGAKKKYNIDMNKSFLVGDSIRDLVAGKEAGIKSNYLITKKEKADELNKKFKCFNNLFECVSFHFE